MLGSERRAELRRAGWNAAAGQGGYGEDRPAGARVPLTTAGPLSLDGDWLPLKTAVLLSDATSGAGEGWLPRTTAGLMSGTDVRTDERALPAVARRLAGGGSAVAGTWITCSVGLLSGGVNCCAGSGGESLSPVVVITGGGCAAKGAAAPRSAVALTECVGAPTVVGSESSARNEAPSSHAHRAIAQMPIVASKVAATTAPRRRIIGE